MFSFLRLRRAGFALRQTVLDICEVSMATRSESRQKTELIQVRATPEEKEALKARAAAFGVSMGALCRETIFGTKPKSKTDQQAILELAQTRADLGRLGGLLSGWLKGSFKKSAPGPQSLPEVFKLLHEIENAQKKVVDAAKQLTSKP